MDIQKTFVQALGIDIWHLNHESLVSTLEGMLNLSELVGIKIQNIDGVDVAMGGIITQKNITGEVGLHVNLLGLLPEESAVHEDEKYNLDVFKYTFPVQYTKNGKTKQLGEATLYSNTSVVFQRVKLGFLLLVINAVLKTTALWLIFLWVSTLLLRKPLGILTKATASISMSNLGSFSVDTKTSGRNEIKILEEVMSSMVANLHDAVSRQKRSEERYRSLFEDNPSMYFKISEDGIVLSVNQFGAEHLGYTVGELVGKSVLDVFYPDDRDMVKQRFADCLEHSKQVDYWEFRKICRDGKLMWVKENVRVVQENDGVKVALVVCDDITEKKEAELALWKSEKKYRTLFEKTSDAIFVVDKKTGKYLDANESALILTGRNWSELNQLTTHDVSPQGAENRLSYLSNLKTTQDLGQTIYIRPDGEKRTTMLIAIPLSEQAVIGIARDITDEMILNERLRQSQKMEAIGTLAGGIAHDFNNILSGIFGYSQLAHSNIENHEKARRHLDQVEKGSKRAAELVQQILTFSRQTEYKKHNLNLFKSVAEALKLLRSSIPSTIEIVKKLDSQSAVYADPIRIHQVVMNLCTNAYHAMRKTGGTLTVTLCDVEIFEYRYLWDKKIIPGEYIKLEVSDTGIGMKKNELDKAFEPYYTTKGLGQGTGLGLALVHAIVDEHDSYLEIQSKPGKGTRFFIYFPKIKQDANTDVLESPKENQIKGNEIIMVVDDEEAIRETYCEFLQSQGYQVDTFSNGIDALKKIQAGSTKFDLVITDLTMPGLSGDKLAIEILKTQPEVPIILCTGYSEVMTETKAIELGIKKYVQKPISNNDLSVLIREILNKYPIT